MAVLRTIKVVATMAKGDGSKDVVKLIFFYESSGLIISDSYVK